MAGLRIHTVMSRELVDRVDSAAVSAGVSRGEFVRRAVEQALGSSGRAGVRGRVPAPVPAEQPSSLAGVDAVLARAAEGLEFNRPSRVRSSSEARPFRPVPKKGEK